MQRYVFYFGKPKPAHSFFLRVERFRLCAHLVLAVACASCPTKKPHRDPQRAAVRSKMLILRLAILGGNDQINLIYYEKNLLLSNPPSLPLQIYEIEITFPSLNAKNTIFLLAFINKFCLIQKSSYIGVEHSHININTYIPCINKIFNIFFND